MISLKWDEVSYVSLAIIVQFYLQSKKVFRVSVTEVKISS